MKLRATVFRALAAVCTAGACSLAAAVTVAAAPQSEPPIGHSSGWQVTTIARDQVISSGGQTLTLTSPDDVTKLGGDVFVSYQNGVGPQGQPNGNINFSTVVAYGHDGSVAGYWNLTGHCDGLTADQDLGVVIATVNEDANSSLYTIDPDRRHSQVTHFLYSPSVLPHGGGTDAISIYRGQILISGSAPGTASIPGATPANMPAVYSARLVPGSAGSPGTAYMRPVFYDGSSATVANTEPPTQSSLSPQPPSYCGSTSCTVPAQGSRATLALTDPDSNEIVPRTSPRFAGDFVLDSQGDQQQIYVDGAGTPAQRLSVLYLSQSVDDTAWVTDPRGTLYITDSANDELLALRGPFRVGQAYTSATPGDANNAVNTPSYLATLDLGSGTVTAVPGLSLIQAHSLLFVPGPGR